MAPLAHVNGVPAEELLVALLPSAGAGGLFVGVRLALRRLRARAPRS